MKTTNSQIKSTMRRTLSRHESGNGIKKENPKLRQNWRGKT